VLEYDNVMNRQREVIYGQRRRVLTGENVRDVILGMQDRLIDFAISRYCVGDDSKDWDVEELRQFLENLCIHHGFVESHMYLVDNEDRDGLAESMKEDAHSLYAEKEKEVTGLGIDMRQFERASLLRAVDRRWMDHIDAMDQLRDGIGYRSYSGKNPVTEYQIEAGHMFEELNYLIREDTVRRICQLRIVQAQEPQPRAPVITDEQMQRKQGPTGRVLANRAMQEIQKSAPAGAPQQTPGKTMPFRSKGTIGRNDPCPCGSGLKYKNCHGKQVSET